MRRWLIYLIVACAILFIASTSGSLPYVVMILAVGLAGSLVILGVVRSMTGAVNPLAVPVLLALSAVVAWAWLRSLGALGLPRFLFPAIVLCVGAALLTPWFRVARSDVTRRRRKMRGLCQNCGYDLRASPDVCPECGVVVNEEVKRRRRIAEELAAVRESRDVRPAVRASTTDDAPAADPE